MIKNKNLKLINRVFFLLILFIGCTTKTKNNRSSSDPDSIVIDTVILDEQKYIIRKTFNGIKNGYSKVYYPKTSILQDDVLYVNGILRKNFHFRKDGKIDFIKNIENSKSYGYKFYYRSDSTLETAAYKINDIFEGPEFSYFKNGKKIRQLKYIYKGKVFGDLITYNTEGKPLGYNAIDENGEVFNVIKWDYNGKVTSESESGKIFIIPGKLKKEGRVNDQYVFPINIALPPGFKTTLELYKDSKKVSERTPKKYQNRLLIKVHFNKKGVYSIKLKAIRKDKAGNIVKNQIETFELLVK